MKIRVQDSQEKRIFADYKYDSSNINQYGVCVTVRLVLTLSVG